MYLCSWWKQSLNPSTLGMLGLRKRLVLHPSQAKEMGFPFTSESTWPSLCRSCYVSTIGFMWLQVAQWCFSWTFVCDLSLAELDSCPYSFWLNSFCTKGSKLTGVDNVIAMLAHVNDMLAQCRDSSDFGPPISSSENLCDASSKGPALSRSLVGAQGWISLVVTLCLRISERNEW